MRLGLTSFAVGVGLHVVFFRQGEWHLWALYLKFVHLVIIFVPFLFGARSAEPQKDWWQSTSTAFSQGWGPCLGRPLEHACVSRAFFHRLTRHGFPGPIFPRSSQLYQTGLASKHLRLCDEVEALHKRYGDFVRIGPREISIADPKAMLATHGTNAKPASCTKGPWYDMMFPKVSLQTTRDLRLHSQRRRLWDKALGSKGKCRDVPVWGLYYHLTANSVLRTQHSVAMRAASTTIPVRCFDRLGTARVAHSM